jgi:hypothetical protein
MKFEPAWRRAATAMARLSRIPFLRVVETGVQYKIPSRKNAAAEGRRREPSGAGMGDEETWAVSVSRVGLPARLGSPDLLKRETKGRFHSIAVFGEKRQCGRLMRGWNQETQRKRSLTTSVFGEMWQSVWRGDVARECTTVLPGRRRGAGVQHWQSQWHPKIVRGANEDNALGSKGDGEFVNGGRFRPTAGIREKRQSRVVSECGDRETQRKLRFATAAFGKKWQSIWKGDATRRRRQGRSVQRRRVALIEPSR